MTGSDRPEPYEEPDGPEGPGPAGQQRGAPRIPLPRSSIEDTGLPLPDPDPDAITWEVPPPPPPEPLVLEHRVLKSLLGAWALAACSAAEATAVEEHLGDCGPCAEEALRLRDAVGLLHPEESLDLDPGLRTRVLESCLGRRPPRIPVPEWAVPYDAESARLDALLRDIGDSEWHAPVRLRWFEQDGPVNRKSTVAGVIAHLLAVDGLVGLALGLDDPLGPGTAGPQHPTRRTEAYWHASRFPPTRAVRGPWRDQTHEIVRTVSFAGDGSGRLPVPYGTVPAADPAAGAETGQKIELPLRDAMVDRAFECWIHAGDIAEAVDYPYDPPAPRHLHHMIALAVRLLPGTLADRRRSGLAAPPRGLVAAGTPGRTLRLEIEGLGGGEWLIPLDSPAAVASADREVAHVALDGVEFCRLAAGHVSPVEAAAGQDGDREAIRDVLFAAASLSRL
ncbi:zf-HC2 domain-containing protein [Streptomyces alboniger]|uniref:MDMPI N domain containing protein n=1 Tax=Streptomyces alboniger TaxID=132473 RepID=A0A5J6HJQ6_STRAD|nr:zf-HC2 domain-containing protein [Streptomyces alboniger]QEV18673.1 MDMPI N domain containing protein [Streptomyces alboniger]